MQISSVKTKKETIVYDYSNESMRFRDQKVRLSAEFREKLLAHRKANRDRLIAACPDLIRAYRSADPVSNRRDHRDGHSHSDPLRR